jgi:hypothetical protein
MPARPPHAATSSGADGAQPIRQRVTAGDGSASGSRPALLPAAQHQRHRAAFLGRQLQPPRRGHGAGPHLAHHRGQAAMAQPFLHHRQHLFVTAAFG